MISARDRLAALKATVQMMMEHFDPSADPQAVYLRLLALQQTTKTRALRRRR